MTEIKDMAGRRPHNSAIIGASILLLPALCIIYFPHQALAHWLYMWSIAVSLFIACKIITVHELGLNNSSETNVTRLALYTLCWPGMDAHKFLQQNPIFRNPASYKELLQAVFKFIFGLFLFIVACTISHTVVSAWLGMIALIFMLHCGSFHILSWIYRKNNIHADPIMYYPLFPKNISQFWGNAWNRAFRDMSHRFIYMPSKRYLSSAGAIMLCFFISGIIHELVITVPAQAAYGGPTLYFLIQGIAVLLVHSKIGKHLCLHRGVTGWLFSALALLGPITLLFPMPFIENVMFPMLQDMRSVL